MAMFIGLFEIFVAFIFFLVFYCFLLHRKTQKPLLTNWPVLGMLPGLIHQLPRIYNWTAEVLEATGMTFCFKGPWLSGTNILFTVDPVNIQYILCSNFANYPKGKEFKKIFEIMGDAIFNVDSGLWEDMRNLAISSFSHPKYLEFSVTTTVSKLKQGLIPILDNAVEENIVVDLQDLCLSLEMHVEEFGDAVNGAADAIFHRHFKPVFIWKLQSWIGVGLEKKLRRGTAVIDQLLANIVSTKRVEIKSQEVDKNWKILIPIYALGRMKSVWGDDAKDFRPERWILASGRVKHEPSYKFLAFNAGPRSCLGKKLTFLQMKTVAVEIIRNYDIKIVEEHKTVPVPSVFLRMQHGLKVSVTKIV
uniref:Cytochrome P450 96A58 n=1 Tax=Isatis tinctoria TaxID=161756 RepID=A0A8F0K8A1_ISATI|nr:cytochrome P450 96A58 [Isatis tinctoria]